MKFYISNEDAALYLLDNR